MKARNKKKLAMMVGMALSITAGMALYPMEADAEVSVTYDGVNDTYTVMYRGDDGATVPIWDKTNDEVLGAINEALSKDIDSCSRVDISGFRGSGEADLLDALTDVKIPAGKAVYLTTSSGTYGIQSSDSGDVNFTRTGSKTFTISSGVSRIETGGNAEITVANGAKIDILTIETGNVTVNSAESTGGHR